MIRAITLALCALSLVSAGPHGNNGLSSRRRHHFRAIRQAAPVAAGPSDNMGAKRRDCEEGAWQCEGTELQRCNYDAWVPIANCTGDNIVCSSDARAVGCIWSWSLDDAQPVVATHISVAEPLPTPSAAASVPSLGQTGAASVSDVASYTSTIASHSATASPVWSAGPSLSQPVISSADQAVSSSASLSGTVTDAPASSSSAAAVIGGNLWAGGDASTSYHGKHRSSTQDWYAAPTHDVASSAPSPSTSDAWSTASSRSVSASATDDSAWKPSTTDWYQPTYSALASAAWSEPSAASSASASSDDNDSGDSSWTASAIVSSYAGRKTRTSSAASQPTGTTGNSAPSGSYPAPHYVIYADNWLSSMPAASDLASYNRFILAFWMAQPGAVDNAQAWEQFDADYRQQVLDEYHAAGIALMVSAFGSTDAPTSDGLDPTDVAQRLAAWVKQYGLDGVDIDYEDMPAMNSNQAEQWLITFQTTLRQLLPAPYLISHAPVAPWFTSGDNYPSGAYVSIHQQTGSGIDWYNVQFYNQGSGVYEDCYSLITDSGSEWPDTSVMGINSYAKVPLDKIVIGKPLDPGAADNGYVDGSLLATCVAQAQSEGWNAGVMFWEWAPLLAGTLMATVRGS